MRQKKILLSKTISIKRLLLPWWQTMFHYMCLETLILHLTCGKLSWSELECSKLSWKQVTWNFHKLRGKVRHCVSVFSWLVVILNILVCNFKNLYVLLCCSFCFEPAQHSSCQPTIETEAIYILLFFNFKRYFLEMFDLAFQICVAPLF